MFKRLLSSQLRINMASGVATTVVNTLVMAVGYPIYLHFLGYEKYGLWLVLSVVLTFAQLGNLGIGPAVTKLVAEDYGRGDIKGIQHYVTTALALLCLSGSVVLTMILLFKSAIIAAFKLSTADAQVVASLVPYIGVLSIYVFVVQTLDATLSGLGRMDLANYIQTAARVVGIAASAILLYRGLGILSLLIGSTLSYLFNHLLTFVCIERIVRINLLQVANFDAQRCKHLLHFGGTVFGGSLISMLFNPFNKLMLSRYAGVSTIPIYEIAYTGSMQVRSLISVGLSALVPEVSRISAVMAIQARNRISQIYRRSMKLIFLFGTPIYTTVAVFAPVLLKLWLRDRFVETLPGAFRIMLVGTFLFLLGIPAYYTLMGMGRVRHILGLYIVQSTVNAAIVICCVLLSSTVSAGTVVFSTSAGMAVSTMYLIWQTQKALKHLYRETGDELELPNEE